MRKMKNEYGYEVNVTEWFMVKNAWEYYVTDDKYTDDIVRCVVMGFETECGDVSLSEVKPFIIEKTKMLKDIAPATGWSWVD